MSKITNFFNDITDALGLTDSEAGQRAYDAMVEGQGGANSQLDTDLKSSFGELGRASTGRDLGTNLDRFGTSMGEATGANQMARDIALGQKDAGSRTEDYLNPMMGQILARTNQAMQGNAGATLQSSATNKNIANAVSQRAGDLWQQAFNDAIADANANLGVASSLGQSAGTQAGLAGQTLAAENQPMEDMLSLTNDRAMQRYAANTGMTQANMQLQGQRDTWI